MTTRWILNTYYFIKPLLPRAVQIFMRRRYAMFRRNRIPADSWPIHRSAGKKPEGWKGWPDGKRFALVLTHDVEHLRGVNRCWSVLEIEQSMGFRSAFNFVPEGYPVPPALRQEITGRGFEVGVHGLVHDGRLYQSWRIFSSCTGRINDYLTKWGAKGFRSPSMYHNLEWYHDLLIEYDSSTFDTDPFEPQSDALHTIYPMWVSNRKTGFGYVELPYTLPQDLTLFVLLDERSNRIWKRKLDWIAEAGGMALLNTHPDYMHSGCGRRRADEYPWDHYTDFLEYASLKYAGEYWQVLPREVASYARKTLQATELPLGKKPRPRKRVRNAGARPVMTPESVKEPLQRA